MARPSLFLNPDLTSPEDVAKAKALIAAMAPNYGHAANVGEGISQLMIGVGSGIKGRRIAKAEAAGRSTGTSAFEKIMGAMSGANTRFPDAPSQDSSTAQPQITSNNEAVKTMLGGGAVEGTAGNARAVDRASMAGYSGDVIQQASKYGVDGSIPGKIVETANAIGADPIDLATVISYETGGTFDPTKRGPTTQYGQHRGLIQFGEPQAAKLGVDWNNPIDSQLGANGAVAKYFQGAGYKPGMGMLDLYSAVNAGSVGRYNASDANNGGAPGTVRDKVTGQMAGHRAKAEKLLAALQEQGQTQIAAAPNAYFPKMMASSQQPQNTQVASLDPSIGMPEQPQQMYVGQVNPNGSISTVAQKPGIKAIATAMGQPAPNGMAPPQQAPAPQQMAQAAPSDIPAMPQNEASSLDRIIGMNTPLGAPQPQGLDVGMLMQAAQNPWLTDTQKTMVNTLLQQEMQKQDPAYQMQQQAAQVGLQRDQLQLEQMRDPSKVPMTPMDQLQMQKSQLELQQLQNPAPKWDIVTGKDGSVFRIDPQTGKHETIYGPQAEPVKPTADIQEYEYAKGQGFQGTFQDFQLAVKKAGASQVNIDQKAEGAFDKKLAEQQATTFDTMATEGMNAKSELAVIGELNGLLKGQGGTLTGLSGALAKYGIGGDGIGDLQAADALINKLIPSQRQPGSGSMSDRDVEMFKASLPSLWKTPGGNQIILQTMEGLAQYKQAQGDIAQRVMTGEIGRQEAVKMLRELPNPLAGVGKTDAPEGVDPSEWEYMTPEERALWN